ncbi:VgrG protein [Minicystis rosea]|nr:VgrG protein [Minicystis rosea]
MNTKVEVALAVGAYTLPVRRIAGAEGFSELFQISLEIQSSEGALPMDTLVGVPAALTIAHEGKSRTLHGRLSQMEQGRTAQGTTTYRATLVPAVFALTQRIDCRVFQKTDVKTVIASVLAEHGFGASDYVLPAATYATRDLIVQYRESDWAFLNRLMEEEGIYYWFEHGDGCTLVMASDGSAHEPLPFGSLEYRESTGALVGAGERVTSFSYAQATASAQVTTWSVAMKTPNSTTTVTARAGEVAPRAEVFAFQPTQSAEHRLASLRAATVIATGDASTVRMAPGGTFALENHPRDDFDATYLVTRVVHDSDTSPSSVYSCSFTAIPEGVAYRPVQRTPRPAIVGPQAATVVGRAGAEVDTDAYGRVLVRMHWDRSMDTSITKSVSASYELWVHVAQVSGGGGAMFLPRAGTHVLVEFIGGDPDKPVVTGRFYSDQLAPPYALPANALKSTLRSKVHGKDDEYSELTFDDDASAKQVYLRAQRSLKVDVGTATEANVYRAVTVHGDDSKSVSGDEALVVKGQREVTVGAGLAAAFAGVAHRVTVTGDEEIAVSGDQSIGVAGARALVVGTTLASATLADATNVLAVTGSQAVSVSGWETVVIGATRQTTIGPSASSASYSAAAVVDTTSIQGSQEINIAGTQYVNVFTDSHVNVQGNKTETIQGDYAQTIYGTTSTTIDSYAITSGSTYKVSAAGEIRIESDSDATKIGGSTIYLSADSDIEIRSATSVSLVIGSLTDSGSWSRKLVLDEDGIYVSNGTVKQRLTGSTVRFNC